MRKTPWWRHPEWVLLYGAIGAIVGAWFGPILYDISMAGAEYALHVNVIRYSDLGDALFGNFCYYTGLCCGAVVGCSLVHSVGKYRAVTGFGLLLSGLWAIAYGLHVTVEFGSTNGEWAIAIAETGILVGWGLLFLVWGIGLIVKARRDPSWHKFWYGS